MADTSGIKTFIEPYIREEWFPARFPGRTFGEQAVPLPSGGTYLFDAVSDDGSIVGLILCNRPKTRTGRENTSFVRKAEHDVQFLKLLPANTHRLLIFTDAESRELIRRRTQRLGNTGIQVLVCKLPPKYEDVLNQILNAASHEQRAAE